MESDAIKKLRGLPTDLRERAAESRDEAGRIRSTVHVPTLAETTCRVRAEVWDNLATELEALLPALEQQLAIAEERAREVNKRTSPRELVEALRGLLECVYQADAADDTVYFAGDHIDKARTALRRAALNPSKEERG